MKDFSISGSVALKRAFAEEVGISLIHTEALANRDYIRVIISFGKGVLAPYNGAPLDYHFTLPEMWHDAVAYAKAFANQGKRIDLCNGLTAEVKDDRVWVYGTSYSKDHLHAILHYVDAINTFTAYPVSHLRFNDCKTIPVAKLREVYDLL